MKRAHSETLPAADSQQMTVAEEAGGFPAAGATKDEWIAFNKKCDAVHNIRFMKEQAKHAEAKKAAKRAKLFSSIVERHRAAYDYKMPAYCFDDLVSLKFDRPLLMKLATLAHRDWNETGAMDEFVSVSETEEELAAVPDRRIDGSEAFDAFPFNYDELFDDAAHAERYREIAAKMRAEYAAPPRRTAEQKAKNAELAAKAHALFAIISKTPLDSVVESPLEIDDPYLLSEPSESMHELATLVATRMRESGALARLEAAVDRALPLRKAIVEDGAKLSRMIDRIIPRMEDNRAKIAKIMGHDPVPSFFCEDATEAYMK